MCRLPSTYFMENHYKSGMWDHEVINPTRHAEEDMKEPLK